jgi:hypothetical protein
MSAQHGAGDDTSELDAFPDALAAYTVRPPADPTRRARRGLDG